MKVHRLPPEKDRLLVLSLYDSSLASKKQGERWRRAAGGRTGFGGDRVMETDVLLAEIAHQTSVSACMGTVEAEKQQGPMGKNWRF